MVLNNWVRKQANKKAFQPPHFYKKKILLVPQPEWAALFTLWQKCTWYTFPEIHLWFDTFASDWVYIANITASPTSIFQQKSDSGIWTADLLGSQMH